jgi:hypothetical protein
VEVPKLTSIGRRGPELQGTWQRVDARAAPCLNLKLICEISVPTYFISIFLFCFLFLCLMMCSFYGKEKYKRHYQLFIKKKREKTPPSTNNVISPNILYPKQQNTLSKSAPRFAPKMLAHSRFKKKTNVISLSTY